jgi:hypothetical protein
VYVGYEIARSKRQKPFNLSADFENIPDGTNQISTNFSEPGGVWLGVSKFCQLADKVSVMASGWYLFPNSGDAEEIYTGLPQTPTGNRTWSTNRSWGWMDGALLLGSPCGINLIGGFRWDSYHVKLRDPGLATPGTLARGTQFDEASLTLSSYIPFVGTQYCCGGPCCGLLLRVIGFPWVPGDIRYAETGFLGAGTRLELNGNYDRGSFLEVFGEYSRQLGSLGCIGIFGRWNYLDVRAHTNPRIDGFNPPPPLPPPIDIIPPIRSSWTVGGRLALNFDLPF